MTQTFRMLADFVRELHNRRDSSRERPTGNARLDAATIAAAHFGLELVTTMPATINVAALALAMPRLTVHEVRAAVVDLVAATDLHSLPSMPPLMLGGACLVEVRDPVRERLFGETVAIGCYELDGARYLVGLDYPDGIRVATWRPQWAGGELDEGVRPETNTRFIEGLDAGAHAEWASDAARFLVVLGLLLDARATPLRVVDEGPQLAKRAKGKIAPARPWAVRYVRLDGIPVQRASAGEPAGDAALEGRVAEQVPVRGHLKRVRVGPGGDETRWIYVASYEARRWLAARPARVVVDLRRDGA